MRLSYIGLIPLFLATAAHSQSIDPEQGGWQLRGGDSGIAGANRLRPSADPGLLTQAVLANTAAWAPATAPYRGYGVAGGTLFLGTTGTAAYNDNVFAGAFRRRSDTYFSTRPEFAWLTSTSSYAFGIDGFAEIRRYYQYDTEDQVNGSVGANFKVAVDPDTQVVGGARYIHGHLERGTSEVVGPNGVLLSTIFNKPIDYDQGIGSVAVNKRFAGWWTQVGIAAVGTKFENPVLPGGINVDLGYANGGTGSVNGRLGYVVAPQTSVFVEVAGNKRTFNVDAFSSQGYRAVGGMLFEPGPSTRLRGEVWAGYMNQDYNGVSFRTVSNWTYGASLAYALTDQLTGRIEGRREAKEAALSLGVLSPNTIGASALTCATPMSAVCVSAIQSSLSGRLDYRLLSNVSVGGGLSYVVDQYFGTNGVNRIDQSISPIVSLRYTPTDRVTLAADYRRLDYRPSTIDGLGAIGYYRNVYLLSMAGKF